MVGKFKKITVAGTGTMGTQIALQIARSGFSVTMYDLSDEALGRAEEFVESWLGNKVAKQKYTNEEKADIQSRITYTNNPTIAGDGCDIVFEAVLDVVDVKKNLLSTIDAFTPDTTIYASNSSYIVSSRFCDAAKHPENVLNVHFFNPALVMELVEIVKGSHVSEDVVKDVFEFIEAIGKTPIIVKKEVYGFVVNRIFQAMTKEACYILDQGIASVEDIDTAVKKALGHRMGPLETLDMTGIDLEYDVLMERYRQTGNLGDKPSPAIVERRARGEFGRKTKKGFYEYE